MATATRGQDLLSSEFLTQLERLALVSRRAFRGRTRGERKSPRKGMSVEFSDYRQYGVGDDLRYVDWNIYGRLDRLYLKLFVDEEDLRLHLLLDGSGSMSFGKPSKLRYAARLAAALGFVGLVNHERVGVAVVRDRMAEGWNPPRGRGQFFSLLEFAARLRAGGPTGLSEGLGAYALRSREAGVARTSSSSRRTGSSRYGRTGRRRSSSTRAQARSPSHLSTRLSRSGSFRRAARIGGTSASRISAARFASSTSSRTTITSAACCLSRCRRAGTPKR